MTTGKAKVQRRRGRVSIRTGLTVRCAAGGAPCSASVKVRKATGGTSLGNARVSVTAGRSAALVVRALSTGAAALRRGAAVRVRIAVTLRRTDATTVERSRTVRLKA